MHGVSSSQSVNYFCGVGAPYQKALQKAIDHFGPYPASPREAALSQGHSNDVVAIHFEDVGRKPMMSFGVEVNLGFRVKN